MKAHAAKPAQKAARKEPAPAVALSPLTPFPLDGQILQRKACACGGGCPRCKTAGREHEGQTLSRPGDHHEREADATAERVMRGSPPTPASGERALAPISFAADAGSRAPPSVSAALRSHAQPLEPHARAFMEQRFGYDFGSVRVHADREAARSADQISADAYTIGNRLVFGPGRYAPHSDSGRRLIAHELAHVVQQAGGAASSAPRNTIQRYGHKDSCPQSFLESHIWPGDALAKRMMPHALNSLCGALKGNPTSRNKRARGTLIAVFGENWESKAQTIYDNLWKLRAALGGESGGGSTGEYIYDCVKGCDREGKGAKETEYGRTVRTAGPGGTIKICYENFDDKEVPWFARTLIHEIGHLMLGLDHGKDDDSGTCAGDLSDAECYAQLVRTFWGKGDALYNTSAGDLCLGGGSGATQDPKNWD